MARISKKLLSPEQLADLSLQLTETVGKMNATLAQEFLAEFFGEAEKTMLAKRLAIIALIYEGRALHKIAIHLHVSESTVAKLNTKYKMGDFDSTIKALTKNKIDFKKFIKILDAISTVGGIMPKRTYTMQRKV